MPPPPSSAPLDPRQRRAALVAGGLLAVALVLLTSGATPRTWSPLASSEDLDPAADPLFHPSPLILPLDDAVPLAHLDTVVDEPSATTAPLFNPARDSSPPPPLRSSSLVPLTSDVALTRADLDRFRATLHAWTQRGSWVLNASSPFSRLPFTYSERNCYAGRVFPPSHNPGMWHDWVPSTPWRVWPLTRAAMCRTLNGRRLVVVGDSISASFHFAALNHLLEPWRRGAENHWELAEHPDHSVCGRAPPPPEFNQTEFARAAAFMARSTPPPTPPTPAPTQSPPDGAAFPAATVRYLRNDYLELSAATRDAVLDGVPRQLELFRWLPLLTNDSVVVMNRGAHFVQTPAVLAELRRTLAEVRRVVPGALLVFRSTPPGHAEWAAHRMGAPARDPSAVKIRAMYNWDQFEAQNRAVRDMLRARFPGVVWLDVYPMMVPRWDQHADPLHYCFPGPVETWLVLLFNALAWVADRAVVGRFGGVK